MSRMLGYAHAHRGDNLWYCCGAHPDSADVKPRTRRDQRRFEKRQWMNDPENERYGIDPDDPWDREWWGLNWLPPSGVYTSESGAGGYWDYDDYS